MPTDHAILAPSAAKRWLACTPSARMEADIPSEDTSYSIEGTLAHAAAELLLRFYRTTQQIAVFANPIDNYNDLYYFDGAIVELEDRCAKEGIDLAELLHTVNDGYVSVVWNAYVDATARGLKPTLFIECRVPLDRWAPESFGSTDAAIVYDGYLHVFDLKYGKGVRVDAEENPQIMLYALGALHGPAASARPKTVDMTIVQPRLHHVSTYTMTSGELDRWADDTLKPRALLAYHGDGDFVPGDHCRFCRARARCRALADACTANSTRYSDSGLLGPDELADAVKAAEVAEMWASAVKAEAVKRLTNGESVTGYKLVAGRSVRKIGDADAARAILNSAGFTPRDYNRTELIGITDLERLVGRKNFEPLLGDLVTRTAGRPTLAPESDPRRPYDPAKSAEDDFSSTI